MKVRLLEPNLELLSQQLDKAVGKEPRRSTGIWRARRCRPRMGFPLSCSFTDPDVAPGTAGYFGSADSRSGGCAPRAFEVEIKGAQLRKDAQQGRGP